VADDSVIVSRHFSSLGDGMDIELHVIGFGGDTDTRQLRKIAGASANGGLYTASNIDSLLKIFLKISGGSDEVAGVLAAEMSKRISDVVTERLSVEYLG